LYRFPSKREIVRELLLSALSKLIMSFPQIINVLALVCLMTAMVLSLRFWQSHRWLLKAYGGLLLTAFGGIAISFSNSASLTKLVAAPMLLGVLLVALAVRQEKETRSLSKDL
jgi:hypothetical protein